jgi:uncharacterized repeat protein (TIGR01451 family)
MQSRIVKVLFILTLLVSLNLFTAVPVKAATLNVPGTYATISAAIAAAGINDTIVVAAGTYNENVNVNKVGLILKGAKTGIPAGPAQFPLNRGSSESTITGTVTLGADNITLDGFTVSTVTSGNGINITGKAVTVENNILTKTPSAGSSKGIYSGGADNFNIVNNNIQGYQGGIYFDGGPNNIPVTIDGNYVRGSTVWAIILFGSMSNGNTIKNNLSEYNLLGLAMGQGGNLITNNTFRYNSSCGIYFSRASFSPSIQGNQVIGNTIDHNTYGIYNDGSEGGEVFNNQASLNVIVCNTKYGVYDNQTAPLLAENNWWGCNNGPGGAGPGDGDKISSNVTYDPWLVLNLSANPTHVPPDGVSTSMIIADMTKNSNNVVPAGSFVPDGTSITFAATAGSITSPAATTNGVATTTYTSGTTSGPATISAQGPTCSDCTGPGTTVDLVNYADLAIIKTVDNPMPLAGGQVVFTLKITNNGPDAATNVVVKETYPAGFIFNMANPAPDPNTDNSHWTFNNLAAAEDKTITITGTVSKNGGCASNYANITSDATDPLALNNTACIDIKPLAIEVTKKADKVFACSGDTVIFTILVLNKSCVDLNLVSFQDTVLGDISSYFPSVLPAERMQTWSYSYTIKSTDPQQLVNFAMADYRTAGSSADITDVGSVTVKCGAVVGGEVAQDDFLRLVIPLFSLAAFTVGGGVIIALKRKYAG